MSRAVFALDLANDPELIAAYEARHAPGSVWPEIVRDIRQRGYREMEIWRVGNRLVMLAEISPDGLTPSDPQVQPVVDRWEAEMDAYQRPIDAGGPKWLPMTRIFSLEEQPES